jgi:DNA mismatch repair protein MutS
MSKSGSVTPMFRQYRSIKSDHPNAILLFRMGDFYEMFYEDAKVASRALELTLTARGKGTDHVVPMCGFPHHQLESYAARLVRQGHRVAVCEQMEDPKSAKGLVRRDVVRVLSPGTILDPAMLDASSNLWAAAIARSDGRIGAAFVDASTGEFLAWDGDESDGGHDGLAARLQEFAPSEIVHPEGFDWPPGLADRAAPGATLTPTDEWLFSVDAARDSLERQFDVASVDGFGLRDRPAAIAAAGGLLAYLRDSQRSGLEHIDRIVCHDPRDAVRMDPSTRRNLEIDRSIRHGIRGPGSLIGTIDTTRTACGARRCRAWLGAPLVALAGIRERLDAVDELVRRAEIRSSIRDRLDGVHDIERLAARAVAGTSSPRELASLRSSLERLPMLLEAASELATPLLRRTVEELDPCDDVADLLRRAIVDEPPATLRDGGVIRPGFDAELDELRATQKNGRGFIASLESREREATGIASLKVKFNKVFGYFIEVSKANLHLVPDTYVRKQTIANGERYVTPELKEQENRILHAQDRIEALEIDRFQNVRESVVANAARLKASATGVSMIDVLAAFAETSVRHQYCRPDVHDGTELSIVAGRHPVVEQMLDEHRFVPNDTTLDADGEALAILTGPNMGGKSTYLRQVALIVLLAQAGCFVPAERASIGVVDRVFCRVGASDSLAEGQSTFMVEMAETANILHHATERSLVLLDEIGRGTATFDGLSIAWAVVEFLHGRPAGRSRTLFATHYHELTELAVQLEGVVNLRMAVREHGDGIVFTHRVERGAADRSYGIHVARLAGIPFDVVRRAEEILGNLEADAYGRDGLPRLARSPEGQPTATRTQASLFPMFGSRGEGPSETTRDPAAAEVLAEIREATPERLTPLDALAMLDAWRRRLRAED